MKKHFLIFLHREHKNDYCDLVAIQAAEMNVSAPNVTAEQFHQIIERNIKESGREGIEATFDDVGNQIFVDLKQEDGSYRTGITIKGVEFHELQNITNEEG